MRSVRVPFDGGAIRSAMYRPFTKMHVYFDRSLIERPGQNAEILPSELLENRVISLVGVGSGKDFSCLMTSCLPEYHLNANGQCFPQYRFEIGQIESLFGKESAEVMRREAITDAGLDHFNAAYKGETITKEDLFYYIYGILHSPDYRERYADNLSKELPRIPRVATAKDFRAFSKAGRDLAALHLNYETVPMYKGAKVDTGGKTLTDADYHVEKMKYGKGKDKTVLHYNPRITVTGIPLEAYDYVVNGKPALDWVVERQVVKTDKASGIVNDANDWAIETMGNPRYPLELFLRVITVSLETMEIVRGLPKLVIHKLDTAK